MLEASKALRYRYLYTIVLVVVTVALTFTDNLRVQIGAIVSIILIGLVLTHIEYQESRIQPASDQFETLLKKHILPRIESEYEATVSNPPNVRINIMLKRRRHVFVPSEYLDYPPWKPTLKIEGARGDYASRGEDELCWKLHQGVAGAAMNTRAQEAWSDLNQPPEVVQTEWHLTDEQLNRASHLNSVLSVPIYLPSDTEKNKPVGVLNIDSTASLSESEFDDESVRDIAIYWSNIIGAIVE